MLTSPASKNNISNNLMEDIKKALNNISGWGSVEIYIQDHKVVQITERTIRKTNHISGNSSNPKV